MLSRGCKKMKTKKKKERNHMLLYYCFLFSSTSFFVNGVVCVFVYIYDKILLLPVLLFMYLYMQKFNTVADWWGYVCYSSNHYSIYPINNGSGVGFGSFQPVFIDLPNELVSDLLFEKRKKKIQEGKVMFTLMGADFQHAFIIMIDDFVDTLTNYLCKK